ncbi:MAG: cytochrome P460 family protein [Pseudomonas sp.]
MNWKLLVLPAATGAVFGLFSLTLLARADSTPNADTQGSPIFGVTLPPGYRNWQLVSIAHEEGDKPDIRAIQGNDIAMKAFREGTLPFPDGAIIARLAYKYEPSAQNNAVFGRDQSFVAGDPTNVQIEIKDSKRYASTGGWGYGQFENGKPNPSEKIVNSCFACHTKLPPATDLIFTQYSQ